jgi:cobalamin biosynthesis Mg chelatase CobN
MSGRRLLAGAGYVTAGVLGIAVAVATAGCGGNGGLSTAITSSLPGLTRTTAATTPPTGSETLTGTPIEPTTEAPAGPPVTVTETLPAVTETLPSRTVTVTETETLPVVTQTLPATTQTLPAATVVTTTVNPAAAAAAGAAVASSQEEEEASSTPWGWIAFGILAAAVAIGALVWWWRMRPARKPPAPA